MKKKIGFIVILGIILSVIGLAITAVSAVYAYQDYKNYSKFNEGVLELKEQQDYSFNLDSGNITVLKSDKEYTYIDYKIVDFYEIKNDNKNINITSKYKFMFPFFRNKNVVNIYLANTDTSNISFTLNAGSIEIKGTHQFNTLDLELNAGLIMVEEIIANKVNVKVNAGDFNMKDGEVDNLDLKVNAGSLNIKSLFTNLNFTVNAGCLDVTAYNTKDEYTINIDKNAGSSNVKNGGSGTRTIKGEVNAGSVNFQFTGADKEVLSTKIS